MNLGKKQKAVLRKAVVDKKTAKVTFTMAKSVYGNKSDARDCLRSLEGKGILQEIDIKGGRNNGSHYKITNLPNELYDKWMD